MFVMIASIRPRDFFIACDLGWGLLAPSRPRSQAIKSLETLVLNHLVLDDAKASSSRSGLEDRGLLTHFFTLFSREVN